MRRHGVDAIVVDKLRKQFDPPKGPVAVDGVSFAIREGEIFSLLGPNGAGKTTTISILSCLLKPDSGEADVGGFSVFRKPDEVKKLIGVVPQDIALYEDLSGRENLMFWGRMYGLSGSDAHQAGGRGARAHRPGRPAEGPGRQVLRRHEAPGEHRRRPAAQAQDPLSRRAHGGHRPAEPAVHPRRRQGPQRRRHDRPLHHPLHGRGPGTLRPDRHHGPGQDDRRRDAAGIGADWSANRPASTWASTATRTYWPSNGVHCPGSRASPRRRLGRSLSWSTTRTP